MHSTTFSLYFCLLQQQLELRGGATATKERVEETDKYVMQRRELSSAEKKQRRALEKVSLEARLSYSSLSHPLLGRIQALKESKFDESDDEDDEYEEANEGSRDVEAVETKQVEQEAAAEEEAALEAENTGESRPDQDPMSEEEEEEETPAANTAPPHEDDDSGLSDA